MSISIDRLQQAFARAEQIRPKIGGFPYLAELLRQAGAVRNIWHLPSGQALFVMPTGAVAIQGTPLASGMVDVPPYEESALIRAIRADQAGETDFSEFLSRTWLAGVVSYEVDFKSRTVTYWGASGETYVEEYPAVDIP